MRCRTDPQRAVGQGRQSLRLAPVGDIPDDRRLVVPVILGECQRPPVRAEHRRVDTVVDDSRLLRKRWPHTGHVDPGLTSTMLVVTFLVVPAAIEVKKVKPLLISSRQYRSVVLLTSWVTGRPEEGNCWT